MSSLSKALGCFGGYVATSEDIREYLINKSRQFIFTSALPAHLCVAANTALNIAKKGHLQEFLFRNVNLFTGILKKHGFNTGNSRSQIIPLFIGSEDKAVRFAEMLLENRYFRSPNEISRRKERFFCDQDFSDSIAHEDGTNIRVGNN